MDPLFKIKTLRSTPSPQQLAWLAMHQDYSEEFVAEQACLLTEEEAGNHVINHLLKGHRGHYGPLEHPQITLNAGYFPHSTMQQLRTHRVGISFDVQSGRYTGRRIAAVISGELEVEEVFYLRPVGEYSDRRGKRYEYTEEARQDDLGACIEACQRYKDKVDRGYSEEHARSMIPFDVRQHFVVSFNMRSLMHLLLIRGKRDAQLECQQFCELVLPHFQEWAPEVHGWFYDNLWLKGRLAP